MYEGTNRWYRTKLLMCVDLCRVGEIVVFKIDGRDIPIVHRVLKLHEKEDGKIKVLNCFLRYFCITMFSNNFRHSGDDSNFLFSL